MGLDMYAYSIREDLVANEPDIETNVRDIANAYLSDPPYNADFNDEERLQYYETVANIREKAKIDNVYNGDFWYWREEYALHDWMYSLYRKRGGNKIFNCISIRLYESDLLTLQEDIKIELLLPYSGEFNTKSCDPRKPDFNNYLEFTNQGLALVRNGSALYYDSWW